MTLNINNVNFSGNVKSINSISTKKQKTEVSAGEPLPTSSNYSAYNSKGAHKLAFGVKISDVHYYDKREWFDALLKMTPEKEDATKMFSGIFQKIKQSGLFNGKKEINVTDIGAGTGSFTRQYVEELRKAFPDTPINVNMVEFQKQFVPDLEKAFEGMDNVKTQVHNMDYFSKPPKFDKKQDLVIMSHSAYNVPDKYKPSDMQALQDYLSPEGLGLMVHETNMTDFNRIGDKKKLTAEVLTDVRKQCDFSSSESMIKSEVPFPEGFDDYMEKLVQDKNLRKQAPPEEFKDGINALQFAWQKPISEVSQESLEKAAQTLKEQGNNMYMYNQLIGIGGNEVSPEMITGLIS